MIEDSSPLPMIFALGMHDKKPFIDLL